MKNNYHKKITREDKFARKYYCQRARLNSIRSIIFILMAQLVIMGDKTQKEVGPQFLLKMRKIKNMK